MHGLGAQEEAPAWTPPGPAAPGVRCPSGRLGRPGRVHASGSSRPRRLSPNACATASTSVDLPEPFSPTRKVTPLARSMPSRDDLGDGRDRHRPLLRSAGRRRATPRPGRRAAGRSPRRSGAELEAVHRAPRPAAALGEAGRGVQRLRARSTPPRPRGRCRGAGTPRPLGHPGSGCRRAAAVRIRRARPCPRYGASTMKQLIAHVSGSGVEREGLGDLGQVVARTRLHPADRRPVDVREVAVVDVAREEVVAHLAVLRPAVCATYASQVGHPPGHAPALAAVLVAGHQREEVGFACPGSAARVGGPRGQYGLRLRRRDTG